MPSSNSPAILVARFLKSSHYYETLQAFLTEAGLSEADSITNSGDWTIEKVLEEKKQYDTSLAFEKTAGDEKQTWSEPAPSIPIEPEAPVNSNILCVTGGNKGDSIFITAADRTWVQFRAVTPYDLVKSIENTHNSPVLSVRVHPDGHILSTSMSGQLMLHHAQTGELLARRRDHLKYAVQLAFADCGRGWVIATIGWDQKLHIYAPRNFRVGNLSNAMDDIDDSDSPVFEFFGDPIKSIAVPSNPESVTFVRNPDTDESYLILSRRDATFLYYYRLDFDEEENKYKVYKAGKQNLAPHANAWTAFSPACLAIHPSDPTLLAVATSHLPHMKLILVRLLFPDPSSEQHHSSTTIQTPASMARAALAVQDREDAAISIFVSTMAAQTPYSTPQVVWRPDGSGVWVNGDDGVIRGIGKQDGKIMTLLKGHEPGSKVRTLWAGRNEEGVEILVSGGFDKKVFIWTKPTA